MQVDLIRDRAEHAAIGQRDAGEAGVPVTVRLDLADDQTVGRELALQGLTFLLRLIFAAALGHLPPRIVRLLLPLLRPSLLFGVRLPPER